MIRHIDMGPVEIRKMIRRGEIGMGGNLKLQIYGTLQCSTGKRMNRNNRVFFISEEEAIQLGFRPCGHCMRDAYQIWKNNGLIR